MDDPIGCALSYLEESSSGVIAHLPCHLRKVAGGDAVALVIIGVGSPLANGVGLRDEIAAAVVCAENGVGQLTISIEEVFLADVAMRVIEELRAREEFFKALF